MKKKIVINVPMHSNKAKSKAMKIAVGIQGVISVKIGENDRLEVIGEVDSVCLTSSLRKKFCFAEIITLEEVKPPKPPPTPKPTPPQPPPKPCLLPPPTPCQLPPPPLYYECREYDDARPYCSIM